MLEQTNPESGHRMHALWHSGTLLLSAGSVVLSAWPGFDSLVLLWLACWVLWAFAAFGVVISRFRSSRTGRSGRIGPFDLGISLALAGCTLLVVISGVPYQFALQRSAPDLARLADAATRGERFTRQKLWVGWFFAERVDVGDGTVIVWLPRGIPKHEIALSYSTRGFEAGRRFSEFGEMDICSSRLILDQWYELHSHGRYSHSLDSQPARGPE